MTHEYLLSHLFRLPEMLVINTDIELSTAYRGILNQDSINLLEVSWTTALVYSILHHSFALNTAFD